MSLSEFLYALPLAVEQWEDDIKKAAEHWKQAQDTSETYEFQLALMSLQKSFCPEKIGGVVYEKHWTLPQLLKFFSDEFAYSTGKQLSESDVGTLFEKAFDALCAKHGGLNEGDAAAIRAAVSMKGFSDSMKQRIEARITQCQKTSAS